ncbi:DNA adenine methylase [Synechocystis sp. PCC 7339]|uniref:DNA adenine methylase n=1 Tax=unclassified Synechocystis TaxID=2640012 RepID=UPI001BB0ADA9|nr:MULTISPECIES: DNA adenine methylase [unclassified Synechocystis]QUS61715.1 DNA adenine methylase [Synechocystis sp. PCC 7338]UAJ73913.1 DNA adenine methylase [Synechocystis sp. PCC 7339]
MKIKQTIAKPFLKWAGGKGKLIEQLVNFFPPEITTGQLTKYAEPFIGGGALYFYVAQHYPQIEKFFISDCNQQLVLAYKTIQQNVDDLVDFLNQLQQKYYCFDQDERKDFFYQQRLIFNKNVAEINLEKFSKLWIEQTGLLIFLNRTCFNGLFRVNSKGEFNVPFGDYKNPKICDAENLQLVAGLLAKTEIKFADFRASNNFIDSATFVYFDPPYRPLNKTSSFTSYAQGDFNDQEQSRLVDYFRVLSDKKAKLMLSNSDPKNVDENDNFFEELYQDFRIERVSAARMINSQADKRGKLNELLITNY